jgi:hypothetical protein
VIQAVVLAEFDGLHAPNAYGQTPLIDDDPTKPNEEYFKHVDWIVNRAAELGLTVGMLPTWGNNWHQKSGEPKVIFHPENAAVYGEFLGRRYKDAPIIWILGGDRSVDNETEKQTLRAMGAGLRKGDGGNHLITLHPSGGGGSSAWFQSEPWLDFNLRQNGHGIEYTGRYEHTLADYRLDPPKPVIDGEPIYEGHPVSFNAREKGHSIAADVRKALYWDLFSGACGHTYGHHSIWQMYAAGRQPINNPLMTWTEAIDAPGGNEMIHARRLLESRPFLSRIPDDSLIVTADVPTSVPGAGTRRFVATRDAGGSYAMVYVPVGRAFSVRMDKISGAKVKAWWFNPRNGQAQAIGEFPNTGERAFLPPEMGEDIDWALILDDASKGFPPPGAR